MAENQPQTAVLCLFCDQPNVMWKCEECGHFICNLCKEKKHSRLKSSDTHRILLIKEIRKNESKPKPVVHGHKCEIEDIVDDLINEVIRSPEYEPCVLSVVCDAIKDIIILEDDDDQNETSVYDMYDVTDIQLEVDDVIDKTEENRSSMSSVTRIAIMCQVCNNNSGKWKCEECSIYMCDTCKKEIHAKLKSSVTHRISLVE